MCWPKHSMGLFYMHTLRHCCTGLNHFTGASSSLSCFFCLAGTFWTGSGARFCWSLLCGVSVQFLTDWEYWAEISLFCLASVELGHDIPAFLPKALEISIWKICRHACFEYWHCTHWFDISFLMFRTTLSQPIHFLHKSDLSASSRIRFDLIWYGFRKQEQ